MSLDAFKAVAGWRLRPTAKLVAFALASFHNAKGGECWPSISRLAESTGLTRRCVITTISQLEATGCVSARRRHGRATRYTMNLDVVLTGEARSPSTGESRSLVKEMHQCTSFTVPVKEVHLTGEPPSSESVRNDARNLLDVGVREVVLSPRAAEKPKTERHLRGNGAA